MRGTGLRRLAYGVATASAVAAGLAGVVAAQPIGDGTGGVQLRKIGSFNQPMYVARAPGVAHHVYVVERPGTVEAVSGSGRRQFLDISGRVSTDGERGLLSIAFDPRYQRNGLFYAYYTNPSGALEIDEFHAPSNTSANEASRRMVLTIPHPGASNHNGGTIAFGPDGFLYLATGDGGTGGVNSQDRTSLLGKVLRINPHGSAAGDYSVPRGNPFVGRRGRDEIFAMGLRNPFRWSFDGSRMAIGDVGENTWEEVDYVPHSELRGANFGWPIFEGDHRVQSGTKPPHYVPPIYEYRHRANRHVITGGLVVHDRHLRSLFGRYLYADYGEGDLRSLVPHLRAGRDQHRLGPSVAGPVAFCQGPRHHVYVAALDEGAVYRLVPR